MVKNLGASSEAFLVAVDLRATVQKEPALGDRGLPSKPKQASGYFLVAGAGPAPDRRAARDGYQLHVASGGKLTPKRD